MGPRAEVGHGSVRRRVRAVGHVPLGRGVGEGWIVPDVDFFEDPDGKIKLCFVDEDEIYVDPQSVDPTAADARHMFRAQMFEEDEIDARWAGKLDQLR
jgi:hypothetical protein